MPDFWPVPAVSDNKRPAHYPPIIRTCVQSAVPTVFAVRAGKQRERVSVRAAPGLSRIKAQFMQCERFLSQTVLSLE
jgi:hypothetical protein